MRSIALALLLLLAIGVAGFFLFAARFNLSAIPEPGEIETHAAGHVRDFLIRRAASHAEIPPAPSNRTASIDEGDKLYGEECGTCHGLDGRTPTDMGRWMYPRAADLTSASVQSLSDRELFWIVKNGLRLSGMPAFGKVEPDEHIWNLAQYVRTLNARPTK